MQAEQSLLHASETCGCESLSLYLRSGPPEVLIHNSCRKRFTDLRHVYDVASEHLSPKKLRSTKSVFDWKSACFLCMSSSVKRNEVFIKSKHYKFSLHLVIIVIFATMCGVWRLEVALLHATIYVRRRLGTTEIVTCDSYGAGI